MNYAARVGAIALSLPGAEDGSSPASLAFTVAGRGFAWSWQERVEPRKPRRPRLDVLAVRCEIDRKEMLLEAAPEVYFTEPHYDGYPSILIRLDAIGDEELAQMLHAAWSWQTERPKRRPRRHAP
jgi:hypothetical protein